MVVDIYRVSRLVKKAKDMLKAEGLPVTGLSVSKLLPAIRRAELKEQYGSKRSTSND